MYIFASYFHGTYNSAVSDENNLNRHLGFTNLLFTHCIFTNKYDIIHMSFLQYL